MTAEPRFVVIRAFTSPIEAHLACSALKGAGIDARLSDIHLVEAQWMYSNAIGGVKVWVPAADEEAARELLDQDPQVAEPAASRGIEEDRSAACPRCGSEDTAAVVAGRRWTFLSWLVLGLPLFPVRRRSRCRHCGHVSDLEPGTQNPEP